ncbi:kinase-like domain-containing protein [Bisporella sp. PMI_857]|nr:kinase-like domain-containing protein [Bisporella sp. PMI_857]
MDSLLRLGRLLKGRTSTYTSANVCHFRLESECYIRKSFQSRISSFRPLIDEIEGPSDLATLVLKHLDDDLLNASVAQQLTSLEIKQVAKKTLEALKVLHEAGYAHTGIKLLVDCRNTVRVDFVFSKDRDIIEAPIWRSLEAQLQIRWDTPTDIWSLGTMLRQHQWFGPFPLSYKDIADDETLAILTYISKDDKPFILKNMNLDPRDRPTSKELLQGEWFKSA